MIWQFQDGGYKVIYKTGDYNPVGGQRQQLHMKYNGRNHYTKLENIGHAPDNIDENKKEIRYI